MSTADPSSAVYRFIPLCTLAVVLALHGDALAQTDAHDVFETIALTLEVGDAAHVTVRTFNPAGQSSAGDKLTVERRVTEILPDGGLVILQQAEVGSPMAHVPAIRELLAPFLAPLEIELDAQYHPAPARLAAHFGGVEEDQGGAHRENGFMALITALVAPWLGDEQIAVMQHGSVSTLLPSAGRRESGSAPGDLAAADGDIVGQRQLRPLAVTDGALEVSLTTDYDHAKMISKNAMLQSLVEAGALDVTFAAEGKARSTSRPAGWSGTEKRCG